MLATRSPVLAMAIAIAIAGCSTTPKPPPSPQPSPSSTRPGGFYQDDGPPTQVPADIMATPDAVPRIEAFHSGASRPYVALGRSFTPVTDDRPIVQRGLASWYGRQFHGKTMSNKEPFDMNKISVAHKKLPLGTKVRVTDTDTGKSITAEVTDRGPYVDGRIIDLSKKAAEKLGIKKKGVANVRVEVIQKAKDQPPRIVVK